MPTYSNQIGQACKDSDMPKAAVACARFSESLPGEPLRTAHVEMQLC